MKTKKTLNRKDLAKALFPEWSDQGFVQTEKQATALVNSLLELIRDKTLEGYQVKIREFGTFFLKTSKPRTGRIITTKESIIIPAREMIRFKVSKTIVQQFNKEKNATPDGHGNSADNCTTME